MGTWERKLLNENGWESGITGERIKNASAAYQADALPGGYYRLTKPNDDIDSGGIRI
ncbi:hypothetical protein MASR1M12_15500 [Erysipelotrichia bacterium]